MRGLRADVTDFTLLQADERWSLGFIEVARDGIADGCVQLFNCVGLRHDGLAYGAGDEADFGVGFDDEDDFGAGGWRHGLRVVRESGVLWWRFRGLAPSCSY